jgi:hypothetical protein
MSLTNRELENELSRLAGIDAVDYKVIDTPIPVWNADILGTSQTRNAVYFIADRAYEIVSITEVHDTALTSADGASLMVSKLTGTTAPDAAVLHLITDTAFSGEDNVYKGFNLKGIAANTVTGATMTNQGSSLRLASGDRLVYGFNGTLGTTFIALSTVLKKV